MSLLSTKAFLGSNTSINVVKILDVRPLPEWYSDLVASPKPTFTLMSGGPEGSLTGSYTLRGLAADLALAAEAKIPAKVGGVEIPFVGGKPVGVSAGFGIAATVPLDVSSQPTVDGFAAVDLAFLSHAIPIAIKSGDFTVTPLFTLDPNTLEMEGNPAIEFALSSKESIKKLEIFSGFRPVSIFLIQYGLFADMSVDVTAKARLVYNPDSGFSAIPEGTLVNLGVTAALQGEVSVGWFIPTSFKTREIFRQYLRRLQQRLPDLFPKGSEFPTLAWKSTVTGELRVGSQVRYSGIAQGAIPLVLAFGGSLNAKIETQLVFGLGERNLKGTDPFNLLSLVFKDLPILFGNPV